MNGSLDIRWISDTLADPPPAPPVLVEGMLRRGELCVIGAPRATGKTWLTLNLAALVGRGDGYLFGALQVVRQEKVLVCHGETDRWMAAVRWRNLVGEGPVPEVADAFERWHVGVVRVQRFIQPEDGSPMWREDELEGRLDERLKRTVVEHGIGLVVIDPWATFYSGAENSNDEVEAAIGELRLLAEQTGTAIVIVHHLGKSQQGRDPEDLWRGASRLADAAATRVTLSPWYSAKQAEDEGILPEEARRYVFVRFLRREAPTPGFVAYLNHDGWWVRPARLPPRHGDKAESNWASPEDVVTALSVDGGFWNSIAQAAESLGISREAASKAMAEAKAAGFVNETKGTRGARRFFLAEHSEPSS